MSCIQKKAGRRGSVPVVPARQALDAQQRLAEVSLPTDPEGRETLGETVEMTVTRVLCLYILATVFEVQHAGYRKLKSFLCCELLLMPICPVK